MTGKDLFASLNFVDDELIEEAAAKNGITMPEG